MEGVCRYPLTPPPIPLQVLALWEPLCRPGHGVSSSLAEWVVFLSYVCPWDFNIMAIDVSHICPCKSNLLRNDGGKNSDARQLDPCLGHDYQLDHHLSHLPLHCPPPWPSESCSAQQNPPPLLCLLIVVSWPSSLRVMIVFPGRALVSEKCFRGHFSYVVHSLVFLVLKASPSVDTCFSGFGFCSVTLDRKQHAVLHSWMTS